MHLAVFILLSLLVHVILFVAIFDVYFTSPVVHGMGEFQPDSPAPASRLVLFVADGLRADKFFELDLNGETRSPYLREIMLNHGTWGISHTRVPTESRPGHIAMIAGFYEDVSAVAKGWKENPVEFDSVFNKSRNTWAFGSPDILPMFSKGESEARVHIHCYEGHIESFAGDDSSLLDDWVFDQFTAFMNNAKSNKTLMQVLNEDKVVFFLHLLGIDTNGHSHKPMSSKYLSNIKKVDEGIKDIVKLLEDFYSDDKKTAFVFASDHGMTDWGSHGAGLPSETLTPLVVWGAGAEKHADKPSQMTVEEIEMTRAWNLDPSLRYDVNQADIAPMMSALVGLPIPVNSVGVLPLPYLSMEMETKAKLMLNNAKQIAEQFKIKMSMVKNNSIYFHPFTKLPLSEVTDVERRIKAFIRDKKFDEAIQESRNLIALSLEGMQYYHTYHRTFLYIAVVMAFLGWIVLDTVIVLNKFNFVKRQSYKILPHSLQKSNTYIFYSFSISGFITAATLYLHSLPISYYIFFSLPLLIWYNIAKQRHVISASVAILQSNHKLLKKLLLYLSLGLLGVWALVFAFFYRLILTFELIVFAFLIYFTKISRRTKLQWISICYVMSVFPALPVVGREANWIFVVIGGLLGTSLSFIFAGKWTFLTLLPLLTGIISSVTSIISSEYGQVGSAIHFMSWSILIISWILPLCSSTKLINRMLVIYTSHTATYLLISLSYDALFIVFFCLLLIVWMKVEVEMSEEKPSSVQELDFSVDHINLDEHPQTSFETVRRSYILLFFLVFAFFGVGNIASINSFDVRVVLPFITVFDPFIMGALLSYKVLLPQLLVACTFCCVAIVTKTDLNQLMRFGLIMSDVMGVHFFFMVKDHGSWLEIGTSISHYVISMSMVTSLALFLGVARVMTERKLFK